MNNQLIKAVIEQLGDDPDRFLSQHSLKYETLVNDTDLLQTLKDVSDHGASGGYGGFIYHRDTCKFARENMPLIIEQLKEDTSNYGVDVFEMVSNFNCLNENYPAFEIASVIFDQADEASINDGADTQILNALAWYALEEVARYITDIRECA